MSRDIMVDIDQIIHSSHFSVVNGLRVPLFKQDDVDKLRSLQLYEDDVWIVSYPKSGSTWLQNIVKLIKNGGREDSVKVSVAVPWLEALSQLHPDLDVEKIAHPRAFKSHFPYHLLPCGPPNTTPCKYIYITRNPKDVAVSAYFHLKCYFPDLDFDVFWELFMGDSMITGNYFDHLASWLPHRGDKNILFMSYEDMIQDLPKAVSKVAVFIGIRVSDDTVAKISNLASFKNMKNDASANKAWRFPRVKEWTFLRKGVTGDWKNYLSSEQSSQVDARLQEFDLKFECSES